MRRSHRPFRRRLTTGMLGAARGPHRRLGQRARRMFDEAIRLYGAGQCGRAADFMAQLAKGAQA